MIRQTEPMPTDIVTKLSAIDRTLSSYRFLSVKLESGVEQLRGALSLLTEQAAGIDSKGWYFVFGPLYA